MAQSRQIHGYVWYTGYIDVRLSSPMTVMSTNPLQKHDHMYARYVDVVFDSALYIILTSFGERLTY